MNIKTKPTKIKIVFCMKAAPWHSAHFVDRCFVVITIRAIPGTSLNGHGTETINPYLKQQLPILTLRSTTIAVLIRVISRLGPRNLDLKNGFRIYRWSFILLRVVVVYLVYSLHRYAPFIAYLNATCCFWFIITEHVIYTCNYNNILFCGIVHILYFSSLEAGIASANSSFKRRDIYSFNKIIWIAF